VAVVVQCVTKTNQPQSLRTNKERISKSNKMTVQICHFIWRELFATNLFHENTQQQILPSSFWTSSASRASRNWNVCKRRFRQTVAGKKLTHYVQVSELGLGVDGVDLAHIAALVSLLDVADVKEPSAMLVMCHRNTGIPRDHVVVYRQYCRLFEVHPRNLQRSLCLTPGSCFPR
jgi:hypothetical protein